MIALRTVKPRVEHRQYSQIAAKNKWVSADESCSRWLKATMVAAFTPVLAAISNMNKSTLTAVAALTANLVLPGFAFSASNSRPNIVVILVDDMGYSDLGCYGGEIRTPHLDELAANGVRFTQFHNTDRCCPTRASLLTGLYPHQAGVGHMVEERRDPMGRVRPGYSGRLNDHCITIALAAGWLARCPAEGRPWRLEQGNAVRS